MPKRREKELASSSSFTSKPPKPPKERVFIEELEELQYQLLIARIRFVRGEISVEALREKAQALIDAVRKRRDQTFGYRKGRLQLAAAELISSPHFSLRPSP